jgi:dolichol-phosphate mannosyltransferase
LGIEYEVIVVDDDSRDGTDAIIGEIAGADPRVRLLTRSGVRGLSGAVAYGWQNADAEVLGVMDADLQHPPELLAQLWQALQTGVDLAVASRYVSRDGRPRWSRFRHLVSQIAILLTLPLQLPAIRIHDPMSGFFMVRRRCIQGVPLQTKGFKILLEILVRGDIRSVVEIPFTFGRRHAGKSKAGLRVGVEYLALLWNLRKQRNR